MNPPIENLTTSDILSIVAIAQTWLIAAWIKWGRRGSIDIYEQGTFEIGLSMFGPTVSMWGTLRAIAKDQFVQNLSCVVTRERDDATISFEWAFLRSSSAQKSNLKEVTIAVPYGFMLSTQEPYPFNIQFHSNSIKREILPQLTSTREAWLKWLQNNATAFKNDSSSETAIVMYAKFNGQPEVITVIDEMKRLSFWEVDEYKLRFNVKTSRPDRSFSKLFKFALTKSDVEKLKKNVDIVIASVCTNSEIDHFFAYPEYKSD